MEIHLKTLEEILNRFKSAGLTISPSKTQIAVKEIDFLGFLISKSGIKANQHNLDKVIKLEPPTHTKGLKKALGLFSFLRKYVKNFSKYLVFYMTNQKVIKMLNYNGLQK